MSVRRRQQLDRERSLSEPERYVAPKSAASTPKLRWCASCGRYRPDDGTHFAGSALLCFGDSVESNSGHTRSQ